ncbi:MAG: hypothetical protein QMD82_08405 [bacterium]|nr:hypothetical protein [bacterium]
MSEARYSCIGEGCVTEHIVKFRNAYVKAKSGESFIMEGDNFDGLSEILKIAKFMNTKIEYVKRESNRWEVKFKKD